MGLQGVQNRHVLNCSHLPCLSILRKVRKVRWKPFAGALSAKFLDMWDLWCLNMYSSILSEEGNKGFNLSEIKSLKQASLRNVRAHNTNSRGMSPKKEETISTSFCSYCTVHPRISKVFRNANELSIHPVGWLSASVCKLQMKKQRHRGPCSHCVTQWH